jgi:DNA-binding GntR family transcriptional regulator
VLSATYRQVNARLQALRFRSNQDGDKWAAAMKEHEQMIEALTQRNPTAMRAVLLSHLNHKRDVVMAQLAQQQKSREAGEGEQA